MVAGRWGHASGELFQIFQPEDVSVKGMTLAEMSEEQLSTYRRERNSAFKAFATWWAENN